MVSWRIPLNRQFGSEKFVSFPRGFVLTPLDPFLTREMAFRHSVERSSLAFWSSATDALVMRAVIKVKNQWSLCFRIRC